MQRRRTTIRSLQQRVGTAAPGVDVFVGLLALAVTLATGLVDPSPSFAQDEPAAAAEARSEVGSEVETPPIVRAAARLVAQLEAVGEDIDDLNQQVARAEGEDRLVLEKQNVNAKLEFLELIGRLVDNILEQEEEQLDASELRIFVETRVVDLTPTIVRHIEQIETQLAGIRRRRDAAPAEELLEYEQELENEAEWLDSVYRGYVENVEHLERLALASEQARADLSDRLIRRADLEAGRIELTMQTIKELGERAGEDPDDPAVQNELAALNARHDTVTSSLERLVRHMDAVGLDATEHQQLLITSTGEVTADIFKPEVAIGLVQEWLDDARAWVRENGPAAFFKALVFVMIIVVARIASKLTRRILERTFSTSRVQVSQLLKRMTVAATSNAVLAIGALVALSQLGLELGPLLAGLGIAGFIVGFALQDSLSNFAAGMMILGYRPFDVGDIIDAASVRGEVSHMSLVNTTILTFDNRTLIVPNNKIWGGVIANLTNQDRRRVDLEFSVAYSDDVDQAERILTDILANDGRVLEEPAPIVKLHELGERGCQFVVRPWVGTANYWDVYWDVTREVKRRFDAEGIRIPYPRRDVYVHRADDGDGRREG